MFKKSIHEIVVYLILREGKNLSHINRGRAPSFFRATNEIFFIQRIGKIIIRNL